MASSAPVGSGCTPITLAAFVLGATFRTASTPHSYSILMSRTAGAPPKYRRSWLSSSVDLVSDMRFIQCVFEVGWWSGYGICGCSMIHWVAVVLEFRAAQSAWVVAASTAHVMGWVRETHLGASCWHLAHLASPDWARPCAVRRAGLGEEDGQHTEEGPTRQHARTDGHGHRPVAPGAAMRLRKNERQGQKAKRARCGRRLCG